MALRCSADPTRHGLEPLQAISDDEALQFLEDHGFFYRRNATIGSQVDALYAKINGRGDARKEEVKFDYFESTLRQDPGLEKILNRYPMMTLFRFPWGTVSGTYYSWDNPQSARADDGLIVYLLSPESLYKCIDGSHKRELIVKEAARDRTLHLPNHVIEDHKKQNIEMPEGGVLLVHPILAHQAEKGRSFIFGLRKPQS